MSFLFVAGLHLVTQQVQLCWILTLAIHIKHVIWHSYFWLPAQCLKNNCLLTMNSLLMYYKCLMVICCLIIQLSFGNVIQFGRNNINSNISTIGYNLVTIQWCILIRVMLNYIETLFWSVHILQSKVQMEKRFMLALDSWLRQNNSKFCHGIKLNFAVRYHFQMDVLIP